MSGTLNTTGFVGSGPGNSGTDSDSTIVFGGDEYIGFDYGTGTATGTTIIGGGHQFVGYGAGATGTAIDTTISGAPNSGANEVQYVGIDYGTGTATNTTIQAGFQEVGFSGGIGYANSTTIYSGGEQDVGVSGGTGTATSTTINNGGSQFVLDGSATITTIENGGHQVVGYQGVFDSFSGTETGTATSTTIYSGGVQYVGEDDGIGHAINTTLSGGDQVVGQDGGTGTATSTTIDSGGAQFVGDGSGAIGTAASTTINAGGYQEVGVDDGTGTATSTTINGGEQIVSSGGTADDDIIHNGGLAEILSGGVVNSPVIAGGTLQLDAGASFGTGGIDFAAVSGARGGTLDLTGERFGLIFAPEISGFTGTGDTAAASDVIDVAGSRGGDHVAWTQDGASGTLQVWGASNQVLETLMLDGTYNQKQFTLAEHASVDQITYDSNAPCYCRGTRILTENGKVAVEDLRDGDRVITASGAAMPIRWIGHRTIEIGRHFMPEIVQPVRIAAEALGEGLPARDLCVSPEHALWLNDALVPARDLVNGATIRQEAWRTVEYFHVELDSHEMLLAEGVAAESYLDCDNRSSFDNAPDGIVTLHADWRARAANRPFASRARTARLQADFAERARRLGGVAEVEAFEAAKRQRAQAARTNNVRNPRAEGAVAGVLGKGGRAPSHWRIDALHGIAVGIVGAGEEDGLPYLDVRFAGESSTSGNCCVCPEIGRPAKAQHGQSWTVSCYLRLTRGGLDGVESVKLYIDERAASGAFLTGQDLPQLSPTIADLARQRFVATRVLRNREVALTSAYLQISVAAKTRIDLTLRVAGFQIEAGAYASDLILPPAGQPQVASRAAPQKARQIPSRPPVVNLIDRWRD